MVAWLLPVYYNILSIIVTRRDELVLKRLRTGEARDGELLLSMCLPGIAISLVVAVLAALVATRHRARARVACDVPPRRGRAAACSVQALPCGPPRGPATPRPRR